MSYETGATYNSGVVYDSATGVALELMSICPVLRELRGRVVAPETRVAEVLAETRRLPIH